MATNVSLPLLGAVRCDGIVPVTSLLVCGIATDAVPSAGSRIAAIIAHLSAPIAALLSAGSLSLLGPLVVWLVMKRDPVARKAAAGAFNFNLAFWVLYLISWLLIFTVIGAIVGIPLIILLFVVSAWCHIKGAIRAADDRPYDYPFQIRVLS